MYFIYSDNIKHAIRFYVKNISPEFGQYASRQRDTIWLTAVVSLAKGLAAEPISANGAVGLLRHMWVPTENSWRRLILERERSDNVKWCQRQQWRKLWYTLGFEWTLDSLRQ
jgi:hypothetical protein